MVDWIKDLFKHDYVFECRFRNGKRATVIYSLREKNVTKALKRLSNNVDLVKHLELISIQCISKGEYYNFSRSDLNEVS